MRADNLGTLTLVAQSVLVPHQSVVYRSTEHGQNTECQAYSVSCGVLGCILGQEQERCNDTTEVAERNLYKLVNILF